MLEKVTNSRFTKVVKDWQEQFPDINRLKKGNKILKRIEFILLGIEIEKYFDDAYRPRFILINILEGSKNRFINTIDQLILDKKNLDIDIKYKRHEELYLEACERLKKQSRIDLLKTPSLDEVIEGIFVFLEKDDIGNPFYSCKTIMQLSRLSNPYHSEEYFDKALELLEKVSLKHLEMVTDGLKFNDWVDKMRSLTPNDLEKMKNESLERHVLDSLPVFDFRE